MKRISLIFCAIFALSCSQQREDQGIPANFAAPSDEAPSDEAPEAEAEESAGGEVAEPSAEPAPAPAPEGAKREMAEEPKKSAAPRRARGSSDATPSGCADQTCFELCKSFGASKQSQCAQAYSSGCFKAGRDPLSCGEFGESNAEKAAPANENVGEMPVPRLD